MYIYFVVALLCMIVGIIVGAYYVTKTYIAGRLIVDSTDPKKDVFSFELSIPADELLSKKYLLFKVDLDSQIEQSL